MAKTHVYPRIDIHTRALAHSNAKPAAEDTTVLFVPLVTKKGPANTVTPIHSLGEFIDIFGSLDYAINGQTALNVYNWLSNGGTVYAYRLADAKFSTAKINFYFPKYKNTHYRKSGNNYIKIGSQADLIANGTDNVYNITSNAVNSFSSNIDTYILEDSNFIKVDEAQENTTTYYNITPIEEDFSNDSVEVGSAKYTGDYYNNVYIDFIKESDKLITIKVNILLNGVKTNLETFSRVKFDMNSSGNNAGIFKVIGAVQASEYIDNLDNLDSYDSELNAYLKKAPVGKVFATFKFEDGKDRTTNDQDTQIGSLEVQNILLENFWSEKTTTTGSGNNLVSTTSWPAFEALGNALETPIDLIMDAGYPFKVKAAMMKFINNGSKYDEYEDADGRHDIVGIFDSYELKLERNAPNPDHNTTDYDKISTANNIAIYDQYFTIKDEIFTDKDIYVSPTYFLSKLLPYNDLRYGMQFPTAGTRRGVLEDAKAVNYNPTSDEKDKLFKDRINYVEKTAREYSFFNQRTHDGSTDDDYTALSFLNNERCLEKMKKELERIGRDYLFEFNDSITLSQLSNVLNRYMNDWVSNRTLTYADVTVAKNPYSDEAVDVTMYVRFTGTIEVISVDITIE